MAEYHRIWEKKLQLLNWIAAEDGCNHSICFYHFGEEKGKRFLFKQI